MDLQLQEQRLAERAKRQEEEARRETNAQAQDVMRALALLYREMAEELEESGLFERRFPPLQIADLVGDAGEISAAEY